ncbi:MAG: glycyl-radical enzyme activating protein [Clostridia bacterium]|nr:glycyl-radical enzyme activating protein [Clostridia bacterium]
MISGRVVNVKRFEIHDGPGIRTTVFLKGCPLRCRWCHNPETLSAAAEIGYHPHKCISCGECVPVCPNGAHSFVNGEHLFDRSRCVGCGKCVSVCLGEALVSYYRSVTADDLFSELVQDIDFFRNSDGGITVSGGEPLIQADFVRELFLLAKKEGIGTAVDTSLYAPVDSINKVIGLTDIFLVDIKAIDPGLHESLTGVSNSLILDNIRYLDSKGKNMEIRIPFVPGCNDSEIEKIAVFVSGLKSVSGVKVLPYHNYSISKYESLGLTYDLNSPIPSKSEIENARAILSGFGINVVT